MKNEKYNFKTSGGNFKSEIRFFSSSDVKAFNVVVTPQMKTRSRARSAIETNKSIVILEE